MGVHLMGVYLIGMRLTLFLPHPTAIFSLIWDAELPRLHSMTWDNIAITDSSSRT